MAAISASLVKELRERTGLGMMDCKKALVDCDGDIEKAIEELRKSSGLKAAKKAGRTASDGLAVIRVSDDLSYGIVVEVNCETDFAARDEHFSKFAQRVADVVYDSHSADVEQLLSQGLEAEREALVQKIGENVAIRRAQIIEGEEGAKIGSYVHNGKIAVLTLIRGGDADLARDISMHIAAANPQVVNPDDTPAEVLEKEKEIYTAQAAESGKPAAIVEKMVSGRIRKFLEEISLVEQGFVRDPDQKVSALLKQHDATVVTFVRMEVGEGIEVEATDFAAEVQSQLKGA